jgi:hypothetical protein
MAHHDAIIIMMRTTLTLPDDIYEIARSIAGSRGISLGDALAELVRRGLKPSAQIGTRKAFPCFNVPANAKPITLEQTLAAEDQP